MQPSTALQLRPKPGVMYGLTHQPDGSLIIREPKILKIGIGWPKGPAVNVWIAPNGNWHVRVGFKKESAKTTAFETREQAERFYYSEILKAPECGHPRKIGFFTFTRRVVQKNESETELFEPDFAAIEAHGPTPTEIDVVFLDNEPLAGAYQMWSKSELRCKGDGLIALRSVNLPTRSYEDELEQAKRAGERYYPVDQCWTNGCPFAGKDCKPGGDLKLQLAKNIRVGGTAYFHTTGMRSIQQIFAALYQIKNLTRGRVAGIPLKMCLRPYKTNHDGKPATQYGVSLEFRAQDVEQLQKGLIEQAVNFANVGLPSPAVRMIDGPDDDPAGITDEFYPDEDEQIEGSSAEVKTEARVEAVAEKVKQATKRTRVDRRPPGSKSPADLTSPFTSDGNIRAAEPTSYDIAAEMPDGQQGTVHPNHIYTTKPTAEKSLPEKLRETRSKVAPGEDAGGEGDLF